jgi:hypothetical protein
MSSKPQLFSLGKVVATPGVLQMLAEVGRHPLEFLVSHVTGDFGDLCEEDKQANTAAIAYGGRVLSSYAVGRNAHESSWKVWIISEGRNADGSLYYATTLLLPEEY